MSATSANTYEKTRLSLSTRPNTSSCPRKRTTPYVPGSIRKQSTKAAAGSRIMTARLVPPLQKGRIHAPAISRSPGWIHSGVIVVLGACEPQLPQKLRDDDDQQTGDKPVDGAPRGKVFEPEVRVVRAENKRSDDFGERERCQTDNEPAFDSS